MCVLGACVRAVDVVEAVGADLVGVDVVQAGRVVVADDMNEVET